MRAVCATNLVEQLVRHLTEHRVHAVLLRERSHRNAGVLQSNEERTTVPELARWKVASFDAGDRRTELKGIWDGENTKR